MVLSNDDKYFGIKVKGQRLQALGCDILLKELDLNIVLKQGVWYSIKMTPDNVEIVEIKELQ